MTQYTIPCSVHATDNDHFQLVELRLSAAFAPQLITGLRALLCGNLNVLELQNKQQPASICGGGTVTYVLKVGKRTAYFCEENLREMEQFVLDRLFGKKKANQCLSITLAGEDELQVSFGLWVNE